MTGHEDDRHEDTIRAELTAAAMPSLSAAVLPSLADNLPNTAIESLLFGIPVIGTDAYFLAIKAGGWLIRIPRRILLPIIVFFCVLGAYAIEQSLFDVAVMLVMGLVGFALERRQIPLGPVVLGIVLGGPLEGALLRVAHEYMLTGMLATRAMLAQVALAGGGYRRLRHRGDCAVTTVTWHGLPARTQRPGAKWGGECSSASAPVACCQGVLEAFCDDAWSDCG